MSAPGADDPRYWDRLRKGPPLDEWVDISSPEYQARMAAKHRRGQIQFRIFCWVMGILVALLMGWGIATADHEPGPYDDIELCQDERGTHPC